MLGISPILEDSFLATVLASVAMDREQLLRQRITHLINHLGVSQKVLAARLGVSAPAFNRWLHKKNSKPLGIPVLDRYDDFMKEFPKLQIKETQGAAGAATPGTPFQAPDERPRAKRGRR